MVDLQFCFQVTGKPADNCLYNNILSPFGINENSNRQDKDKQGK